MAIYDQVIHQKGGIWRSFFEIKRSEVICAEQFSAVPIIHPSKDEECL